MFSIERMHYFRASTVRDPTMITTDISGYLKYIYLCMYKLKTHLISSRGK